MEVLLQALRQVQPPAAEAALLTCFQTIQPPPFARGVTGMVCVGGLTAGFWEGLQQQPQLYAWAASQQGALANLVQEQLPHLEQPPAAGTPWSRHLLNGMQDVSKTLPALGRTSMGKFLRILVGVGQAAPSATPTLSNLGAALAEHWPLSSRLAQPELLDAAAQVSCQQGHVWGDVCHGAGSRLIGAASWLVQASIQ